MKKKLILAIIFAPLLAIIPLSIHVYVILHKSYQGEAQTFQVKAGEGFSRINYRLYKQKIIGAPRIFHYYAKYKKALTKIKAGSYQISQGLSMLDILDLLTSGKASFLSLTLPEGKNRYQIAQMLEEKKITKIQDFLQASQDRTLLTQLLPALDLTQEGSAEGYLYPETYNFLPETPATEVLKMMIKEFHKKTQDIDFDHPLLSPHEIIILASVVEKETGARKEKPIIAGVFLNRLRKNMKLQSDPTTIYGLGQNFKGNLTRKHLKTPSAFNTYTLPRLPLGPIANPGRETILAVLNPAEHDYLYFVSKNDGTHYFSQTYEEHLQAVRTYQLNEEQRQGKSWRDLKQDER